MFFLFFVNNDFDVQAAFQKGRNEKKRFLNIFMIYCYFYYIL